MTWTIGYRVGPIPRFEDTVVFCVLEYLPRIGWVSVKKFNHTITTIIILLCTFCFRTGIFWPPDQTFRYIFVHEFFHSAAFRALLCLACAKLFLFSSNQTSSRLLARRVPKCYKDICQHDTNSKFFIHIRDTYYI